LQLNTSEESTVKDLNNGSWATVDLTCEPPVHVLFALMFQQGFMLRGRIGSTIREALCEQWGIETGYLDGRINTVFLDGSPVDDVDKARLAEGSVLALSASMPGFVGAALRKGGFYAKMRQGITHVEDAATEGPREGFFMLKLFNMVAEELGPLFLKEGIWLDSKAFEEFFRSKGKGARSKFIKLRVNDHEVDGATLAEEDWSTKYGLVFLRVVASTS
jgi:hypothetical protein